MQFFKFVILSITRILDELSFVLVDVILGYRHQVMHRSHELALDDHFSHPEEIGIGLPVVIHAFGADVEILVALFPTAHIPEAVPPCESPATDNAERQHPPEYCCRAANSPSY